MKNRATYIGSVDYPYRMYFNYNKLFVVEQARINGTVAWYWFTIGLRDLE